MGCTDRASPIVIGKEMNRQLKAVMLATIVMIGVFLCGVAEQSADSPARATRRWSSKHARSTRRTTLTALFLGPACLLSYVKNRNRRAPWTARSVQRNQEAP
jgi:hypothetical protein